MTMATERLKTPLLFPCADRVKMPQLGSEDSDIKLKPRYAPTSIVMKSETFRPEPVSKDYVQRISMDLKFEEDVVKERCFHALPYDEKYMYEAFDISGLVSYPKRTKIPVGRHDARGTDVRHMPCNLTKSTKPYLKPLKRRIMQKALEMHRQALEKEAKDEERRQEMEQKRLEKVTEEANKKEKEPLEAFFLTETRPFGEDRKKKVEKEEEDALGGDSNDWDAYLMSILSQNTANWIVYEKTPSGTEEHEKLEKLLKKWYGEPEHTDLIRDEISDTEEKEEEEERKRKLAKKKPWKKREASLLQRVYNLEEAPVVANDPYSDENAAPFYRQPAGLRRARKHEEKEEQVMKMSGAINTTAKAIEVKRFVPPPPPKLRDFLNSQIGDHILDTDNMFQQEMLVGTTQHHEMFGDPTKIVMDTNNKYKKELQSEFPQPPENWYPQTNHEKRVYQQDTLRQKKQKRGLKRWKQLPEPIDDTAETLKVLPPGYDIEFHKSADPRTRKTAKSNPSLMQIIDEWRNKWHLSGQYADSKPDDLIKDMADIQPHVRLKAIATIAKAAEYRPPQDQGIKLDFAEKQDDIISNLPEKLFVALECLLDDSEEKVRKAAAITLYSLDRPCDRATDALYEALHGENLVDRWAAAQCLAHFGICDSDIVGEILRQIMNTEDTIKHERGINMLGVLSVTSRLVHSMVAEQLNSTSWRCKVIACKILPTLQGDINKDITNKLSDLMWNDWHEEVRRAAAQCLGKTGHGRDVHDDLRMRILEGDEKTKLEAITKVGQLGIMTAKLLPAFLQGFDNEYVAVRSEVCITCGNLAIKEEQVLDKLIHLATFDPIWKVKALAFQAMGKIGVETDQVVECLLWAVRYEEKEGVRAEACHTLRLLKVKNEVVAEVLQDRFLVESSKLVREEIAEALKMFDISATEDMDMVAQIKNEVRKLCTRDIIATQIHLNEMDDDRRQNLKRMIYESEKELEEHEKEKEPMMERVRALSRASKSGGESAPSTPDAGREILFTPTADKELEAIMSREDVLSEKTTPATTPRSKSRTDTGVSGAEASGEESEEDVEGKSTREKGDETESSSQRTQTPGDTEGEETEPELAEVDEEKDDKDEVKVQKMDVKEEGRPVSVVKFAATLEVAGVPARSKSSLLTSRNVSFVEEYKMSRMGTSSGFGADRMVYSRDAMKEREKVSEEARNTYAGLDMRYQELVDDLDQVDNTYQALIEKDKKALQEKLEQEKLLKQQKAAAARKGSQIIRPVPKIELTADEEFDVEDKSPAQSRKSSKASVQVESSSSVVKVGSVVQSSVQDSASGSKSTVQDSASGSKSSVQDSADTSVSTAPGAQVVTNSSVELSTSKSDENKTDEQEPSSNVAADSSKTVAQSESEQPQKSADEVHSGIYTNVEDSTEQTDIDSKPL